MASPVVEFGETRVDEAAPFPLPQLDLLLASGGARDIWPDLSSRRTPWGTTVAPASHEIWFSSTAAQSISRPAYDETAAVLDRLLRQETAAREAIESDPAVLQKSSGETIRLEGKKLVNAAGPWASRIAKLIGYETPVFALRRQVSIFDVRGFDMSHYGMMVDTSGVYFHPEATNILGGYADHEEKPGWNLNYDGESFFQEKIWMPLYNRATVFEQLKHLTGWGGLYEVSPDQMGVLGRVEGFANVFENPSSRIVRSCRPMWPAIVSCSAPPHSISE